MNTHSIEKIIENIKSYGYHPDTINHNENYIDIHYDSINFSFDPSHKPLAITVNANIEYRMTFDQENIEYLNSKGITKWSIFEDPELKEILLATGDRIIVEASPYDRIWGVGLSEEDDDLYTGNWKGQNLLGKALMEVRDKFQMKGE